MNFVRKVLCMEFDILLNENDISLNGRELSCLHTKPLIYMFLLLHFISNDNFPPPRIWWIVSFALSVFLCVNLIYTLWLKWQENPVIISFDHTLLSIGEIPFPAITLCPLTRSRMDKFNYTNVYRLMYKLDGNSSRMPNETE